MAEASYHRTVASTSSSKDFAEYEYSDSVIHQPRDTDGYAKYDDRDHSAAANKPSYRDATGLSAEERYQRAVAARGDGMGNPRLAEDCTRTNSNLDASYASTRTEQNSLIQSQPPSPQQTRSLPVHSYGGDSTIMSSGSHMAYERSVDHNDRSYQQAPTTLSASSSTDYLDSHTADTATMRYLPSGKSVPSASMRAAELQGQQQSHGQPLPPARHQEVDRYAADPHHGGGGHSRVQYADRDDGYSRSEMPARPRRVESSDEYGYSRPAVSSSNGAQLHHNTSVSRAPSSGQPHQHQQQQQQLHRSQPLSRSDPRLEEAEPSCDDESVMGAEISAAQYERLCAQDGRTRVLEPVKGLSASSGALVPSAHYGGGGSNNALTLIPCSGLPEVEAHAEQREAFAEINRLQATVDRLQKQLAERAVISQEKDLIIEELRRQESQDVQQFKRNTQKAIAERDEKCNRLTAAIRDVEKALQDSHAEADKREMEFGDLRLQCDRVSADVSRLKRELTASQHEAQSAKIEAKEAAQLLASRDSTLAELRRRLGLVEKQKEQAVARAQSELKNSVRSIEDKAEARLQQKDQQARTELTRRETELINKHEASKNEISSRYQQHSKELESHYNARIRDMETAINNAQSEMAAQANELSRSRNGLSDVQEQKHLLEQTVAHLQTQLARARESGEKSMTSAGKVVPFLGLELLDCAHECQSRGPCEPYLGVKVHGARGPALEAGLKVDDIVTSMELTQRKEITDLHEFKAATAKLQPDDVVRFTVCRPGAQSDMICEVRVCGKLVEGRGTMPTH